MPRRSIAYSTLFVLASSPFMLGCPSEPAPQPVGPTVSTPVESEAIDDDTPIATIDTRAHGPSVETEPSSSTRSDRAMNPPPEVAIERPGDFLRPTLPDAALEETEEPAEPAVVVTDRSAEADDPATLPGGTEIGDLYDGIPDEPKPDDAR